MSKVLIVVITAEHVEPECWRSILRQTYHDCDSMVFQRAPRIVHEHFINRLYRNCSETRERARKMALASDADYFLFMDSDIVIPPDAVEEFLRQVEPALVPTVLPPEPGKIFRAPFPNSDFAFPPGERVMVERKPNRIIGGWYTVRGDASGRYTSGRVVGDNTFLNFTRVDPSLVHADVIGLGCAFMPRAAIEKIEFKHGCDIEWTCAITQERMIVGECGAFAIDAMEAGFELFMDGEVVCKHLERTHAG